MEEHGDDSKMDPMDTDCVTASVSPEAPADGFQESMKSKSSHAAVRLFFICYWFEEFHCIENSCACLFLYLMLKEVEMKPKFQCVSHSYTQ